MHSELTNGGWTSRVLLHHLDKDGVWACLILTDAGYEPPLQTVALDDVLTAAWRMRHLAPRLTNLESVKVRQTRGDIQTVKSRCEALVPHFSEADLEVEM